jgi:hypothetical protein
VRPLTTVAVALAVAVGAAADVAPGGEGAVTLQCQSAPLASALADLGGVHGVSLTCEPALAQMPLTLALRDMPLKEATRAIVELLSPSPDAAVRWLRRGAGWELRQDLGRRRLIEELRDADLAHYRAHIMERVRWLEAGAPDTSPALADNPEAVAARDGWLQSERYFASRYRALGAEGVTRLLKEQPIVWRVGGLPEREQREVLEYLLQRKPSLQSLSHEERQQIRISWILSRTPGDPRGAFIVESVRRPLGSASSGTRQMLPGRKPWPFLRRTFRLLPPARGDQSRRVTAELRGPRERSPDRRLDLNDLLLELAGPCGVQVISDGYRRPRLPFPERLVINDYPIRSLLDALGRLWGFDYRFLDSRERILLIRDRGWWMEDEAHIPEPDYRRLRQDWDGPAPPPFEALLRLGELSRPQARRLVESERLPRLQGAMVPPYLDEGAIGVLRVLREVSEPLRRRALTSGGLSLGDVAPTLRQQHLTPLLFGMAAAHTPEEQAACVVRVEDRGPAGWVVEFRAAPDRAHRWAFGTVGPITPIRPSQ